MLIVNAMFYLDASARHTGLSVGHRFHVPLYQRRLLRGSSTSAGWRCSVGEILGFSFKARNACTTDSSALFRAQHFSRIRRCPPRAITVAAGTPAACHSSSWLLCSTPSWTLLVAILLVRYSRRPFGTLTSWRRTSAPLRCEKTLAAQCHRRLLGVVLPLSWSV